MNADGSGKRKLTGHLGLPKTRERLEVTLGTGGRSGP
jgi:hypothetical protein